MHCRKAYSGYGKDSSLAGVRIRAKQREDMVVMELPSEVRTIALTSAATANFLIKELPSPP